MQPLISVVIPVYNDTNSLKTCLKALSKQTYSKDKYEVIVVNNNPEENIEAVAKKFEFAKVTYEPKCGSYAARNKGLTLVKSKLVAFTDADCIPDSDWLEKGAEALLNSDSNSILGGVVDLFFKNPEKPTAIEFYDSITYLDQKHNVQKSHFSATANLFAFTKIFKDVGFFNDDLKSGGDMDWGNRAFQKGYNIIFSGQVRVKHPARSSLKKLLTRAIRVAGGYYDRFHSHSSTSKNTCPSESQNPDLSQYIWLRLKPPIKYIKWKLADERISGGLVRKMAFSFLVVIVNYAVALELIRLKVGGKSIRW